jgi:hypothetical protein
MSHVLSSRRACERPLPHAPSHTPRNGARKWPSSASCTGPRSQESLLLTFPSNPNSYQQPHTVPHTHHNPHHGSHPSCFSSNHLSSDDPANGPDLPPLPGPPPLPPVGSLGLPARFSGCLSPLPSLAEAACPGLRPFGSGERAASPQTGGRYGSQPSDRRTARGTSRDACPGPEGQFYERLNDFKEMNPFLISSHCSCFVSLTN